MKTRTLALTVLLAALLLTPLALAGPDGGPRRRGPRGGAGEGFGGPGGGGGDLTRMLLGRLGEELELTDAQKESIREITENVKEAIQANRQAVQEAMQALHEAADTGDEAAIRAAGQAAGDALTKQALQRADIQIQVKEVLTDEQEQKLDELKADMRQRMQERHQQRRDNRDQGRGRRGRGGNDAPVED